MKEDGKSQCGLAGRTEGVSLSKGLMQLLRRAYVDEMRDKIEYEMSTEWLIWHIHVWPSPSSPSSLVIRNFVLRMHAAIFQDGKIKIQASRLAKDLKKGQDGMNLSFVTCACMLKKNAPGGREAVWRCAPFFLLPFSFVCTWASLLAGLCFFSFSFFHSLPLPVACGGLPAVRLARGTRTNRTETSKRRNRSKALARGERARKKKENRWEQEKEIKKQRRGQTIRPAQHCICRVNDKVKGEMGWNGTLWGRERKKEHKKHEKRTK